MPIPKIIHQTYKSESSIPEHWLESRDSWKNLENEGWEYKFWTDESMREFIAKEYEWFLEQYDNYEKVINRVDAWRLFALHFFGGIYVDMDIVCKSKEFLAFFHMIEHEELILPSTKTGNDVKGQNLSNCFMFSQPRSEFWPHTWEILKDPYKYYPYKSTVSAMSSHYGVIMTTGPGLISDAYHNYPKKDSIYILPSALGQPLDDSVPKPHNTRESIVKIIEGSSWHDKSANFWRFFGIFSRHSKEILGALLGLAIIVIIVLSILYRQSIKRSR